MTTLLLLLACTPSKGLDSSAGTDTSPDGDTDTASDSGTDTGTAPDTGSSPGPDGTLILSGEIVVELQIEAFLEERCVGEVRFTLSESETQAVVGSMSCEFTMYFSTTGEYGPQRADFVGNFVDETTIVGEAYVELLEDVSFIDWTATYDGTTLSSTVSGSTQWMSSFLWPVTWTTTFAASR